jgi:hypothetical protein
VRKRCVQPGTWVTLLTDDMGDTLRVSGLENYAI